MKIKSTKIHFILAILWIIMIIPSIMWWRNSVLFVIFISLYANVANHWGAYDAAKAKELIKDID